MAPSQNRLLAALPAEVLDALQTHLRIVKLQAGQVLSEVGEEIRQVYFPQTSVISLVVELQAGDIIETAMIGRDGVVNAAAALDGRISFSKCLVQFAGTASVVDVGPLREIAPKHQRFRSLLSYCEEVTLAHVQQSVACNARHSIEARACRWLLRMRDLTNSEDIGLTHEQLAQMLGVRRAGVSVVAENLQKEGLIKYHRGLVRLYDIERLRQTSCECYGVVETLYEKMRGFGTGDGGANLRAATV
jgi:CRP-like cAMP-binding protein